MTRRIAQIFFNTRSANTRGQSVVETFKAEISRTFAEIGGRSFVFRQSLKNGDAVDVGIFFPRVRKLSEFF